MKPERAFIAERALARHCPELVREPGPAEDWLAALSHLGDRVAATVAAGLAPLVGGDAPQVRATPARDAMPDAPDDQPVPLVAAGLFDLGATRLALVLDADPVLRLVDRAFGGRGDAPDPLPDIFPLSAELMIERLHRMIADALIAALGGRATDAVTLARADSVAQLGPFAPDGALVRMDLEVAPANGRTWCIHILLPRADLPALLGEAQTAALARRDAGGSRDVLRGPFADLPLPLRAVLVDMNLPVSALAGLRPGQVIPVAVARSIPLFAGDRAIAQGEAGAFDDRVALRLTQTFHCSPERTP